ncbi:MAG: protoporphyrinogen oxidase [Fimbriiglobus sp.]
MKKVLIVGGGLSGLTVAFRLRGQAEIRLVEARRRVGGNLHTTTSPESFRVEWGPNGFLDSKPTTLQLCQDLGLGPALVAGSEGARKNRFLFLKNSLQALPGSPTGLLTTPLLSLRGKLELLAEPLRRTKPTSPDESVLAFATRRMGREAARVFMEALVTGIHAADPEKLSVRAAFPRLAKMEVEHGSILRGFLASAKVKRREAAARGEQPMPQRMWSFRGGLQVLIDALEDVLGGVVSKGLELGSIRRTTAGQWEVLSADGLLTADHLILTCPAYEQARLLSDIAPSLAEELREIAYNRIVVVALGYRASDAVTPDGFGYIAPHSLRRTALGVQWCSAIFAERAPPGFVLWRALCGGASRPELADLPEAEIVPLVHREMQATMGVTGQPVFSQVVRWPKAIPQYHIGHLERVSRIETLIQQFPHLHLTGNAFHGVAMNDVVEQANLTATRVVGDFKP